MIKNGIIKEAELRAKNKNIDKDLLVNAVIAYHNYLKKAGYKLVYEGKKHGRYRHTHGAPGNKKTSDPLESSSK